MSLQCFLASAQDVITFKSGTKAEGVITQYSEGMISIVIDGETKQSPINNIHTITFRNTPDPAGDVLKQIIPAVTIEAKKLSLQKGLTTEQQKENKELGVQFLAVAVVVNTKNSEQVDINHDTFVLRDNDGIDYKPSTWGLDMLQEISKRTVSRGESAGGWVGFSIPSQTDMTTLKIRYENGDTKSNWIPVPRAK